MSNLSGSSEVTEASANPIRNVELSGNLSIRDAEKLRQDLNSSIEKDGNLRVKMGNLSKVDTSVFQILIAATRSAEKTNCKLHFDDYDRSPIPGFMTSLGLKPTDIDETWVAATKSIPPIEVSRPEHTEVPDEKELFWLSQKDMKLLQTFFPEKKGRQRADDCNVLSGIIYVKKNDLKWNEAPSKYGHYKTLYMRWKRWSKSGLFENMYNGLSTDDPEQAMTKKAIEWALS